MFWDNFCSHYLPGNGFLDISGISKEERCTTLQGELLSLDKEESFLVTKRAIKDWVYISCEGKLNQS